MRLDKEDLHQQIKSQDSLAPALLNDSGRKKWLNPHHENNEISPTFWNQLVFLLKYCLIILFISLFSLTKIQIQMINKLCIDNFSQLLCNDYFYIVIFSLHKNIIVINSKFPFNVFLMGLSYRGGEIKEGLYWQCLLF